MADEFKLGNLQNIVVTIVVIGLILGIGLLLLREIGLNSNLTTVTVSNETLTPTTDGTYVVNNMSTTDCFSSFTVLRVTNVSAGYIIESGNYSTTEDGRIYNLTSSLVTNSSELDVGTMGWNITYSYAHGADQTCQAVEQTQTAISQIPTWLGIIVIVVIVGIVLIIVFSVLPKNGENGGNFGSGGNGRIKMGGGSLFGGSGGDSGSTAEL